jgi:hypothetical protein
LSGVVISDGLRVVKQSLDKIDEVVDQWLAKYDNDFKLLENKKIPGNDEIKNKDLLKQIDLYYGIILNGEGAPKIMGKDDWYIKQLSDFKDLIKYYVQYKADEVLIEIKKNICNEIASGPHGDMQSRKIVRDLIAKLDIEVDVDMSKKANSLIELFKTYADDPLTRVVPDVSKFVSGFDDSDINLFKEFYETKCGLSFRKEGMVLMQNRKKKQEISADLKTLEDLISMVIEDKSLLISLLNGSTTVDSFVLSLRELLINSLETQNLRSSLPKFGEISNLKLKDWVEKYPADFENYKGDFMNRASLFCSLNTANIFDKKLWVTSLENQHLCSEIINHNKTNNIISELKTGFTNEDVVAMIRMAENISFDDYTNYPHYKDHYAESIRTIPDVMFPHLDVRFKREMKNYPSSVDDNSIIADLMKRLSTSSEQTNTVTGNTDRVKIAFGIYGKLYFLSKFYEILKSNQIRSTLFVEPSQDVFGDPLDFPVFFKAKEILFYDVKTTSWGTISILNESSPSAFSLYNNSQLLNDYRKSVFEQDHNPLWQNLIDYQAFLSDQINVIKIQKIRERTLTARVNTVIQESIKSFTTHIKEIVPEEAKDSLMQIFREIKTELDKI